MRVIITGERGYIATNLKKVLENKGAEVSCLSFRNGGDIAVDGCECLVHCAAIVHKKERQYKDLYDKVNHIEAVRLAQKAKRCGVSHFVFISTMSVYGLAEGEISSDTPCKPTTLYGKSKLAAEREILALRDDSFKVTVIRPPMVYGKDCPGNFAALRRLALMTPVFPKTDNKRSMIYIGNLTNLICDIITAGTEGIVLPMDGKYVNTADMVGKIAHSLGKRVHLSPLLGSVTALLPLKIVKKVLGSLYYNKADAVTCEYFSLDDAIKNTMR